MRTYYAIVASPIGALTLASDGDALTALLPPGHDSAPAVTSTGVPDPAPLRPVIDQLVEYFAGERAEFDVAVRPRGTAFQHEVWTYLRSIPFAQTRTYGQIALELGRPAAARAVGAANGRNPISVVIPCHRVVGASGGLTGYAGGLSAKGWLLRHEQGRAGQAPGT